jgi:hypothetical protein
MENTIVYPFKYDCGTGEFLYAELERQLRKNAASGNGKARASGFAVPVLGHLPKYLWIHTYSNVNCK